MNSSTSTTEVNRAKYELEDTKGKPFVLQPKQLILGITRGRVAVPNDLVASIEGRSSVA
jgi:deoxycytidine triphosphate deaminase